MVQVLFARQTDLDALESGLAGLEGLSPAIGAAILGNGTSWETVAQQSAIASLTNSTGGTADNTLATIGDTTAVDQGPALNDNLTELNDKLDAILAALRARGTIAT